MDYRRYKYIRVLNVPDLASISFSFVTQMLYYTHYTGVEEVAFTVWRTTKCSKRLKKFVTYETILLLSFKHKRERERGHACAHTHSLTHTHNPSMFSSTILNFKTLPVM
jgi:hypothetical protein